MTRRRGGLPSIAAMVSFRGSFIAAAERRRSNSASGIAASCWQSEEARLANPQLAQRGK